MALRDILKEILAAAEADLKSATFKDLEQLKIKYLGRKSALSLALRQIKDLPDDERGPLGRLGNEIKQKISAMLEQFAAGQDHIVDDLDFTIPGIEPLMGHLHPITQTIGDLIDFFAGLGFSVAEGPEVETEEYNFDLLNIPPDHPARDMWDTFWVSRGKDSAHSTLLRTHTSPVQLRYMRESKPPIRIIAPGRTFRYEAEDATHSSVFYQLEGLMVDKGITLGHLKAVIDAMVKHILGDDVKTRLRPSYFPFTEPSFEVDVWFEGRWLELMGCGMVNPKVLENGGIDSSVYTGFAFGMGIERIIMAKYKITDIRNFYGTNFDFLKQF
ncbi:MAG: phenylalanine--tRNA ligase subunit alpha [Patescibacteria group bacterium]|nr:phenylalanine--tRNA ligase subunit alpha [Patescibacteria group bacterium]